MLQQPRPWTRLIIADPGLIDSIGHHLGYSLSVAEAARDAGLPPVILAGHGFRGHAGSVPIRPVFNAAYQSATRPSRLRGTIYGVASLLPAPVGRGIAQSLRAARRLLRRSTATPDRLGVELAGELAAMPDAAGALVLLHSVSAANLAGLPAAIAPEAIGGLSVVLRRTPVEMDTTDAAADPIAVVMTRLRAHFGARLRVFADTEDLAAIYHALLGQDVIVAPLPVVTPPIRSEPVGNPPHLVFAGGARAEKGYMALPALVRRLRGRARFTIHSGVVTDNSDPLVQAAHRALKAMADPAVTLLEQSLDPESYLALIGSADLLLLPYDGPAYGPRSSGILAEARAMGVPAAVPARTWMETAVGPSHAIVFDGIDDFPRAVEAALADLPALSAQYRAAAGPWRARHNPASLGRILTDWQPTVVPPRPARV